MKRLPSLKAGLGKPVMLINFAYWVALLIIAAMLLASFMLLQQMISAQQRNEQVISLASEQRALSQRVVFLANAADTAPALRRAELLKALRQATSEFEANYDILLEQLHADPLSAAREDASTVENALFSQPYHLDYFSGSLAANGWRFAAALESEMDPLNAGGYLAGKERARLDEVVANATMDGYAALRERLAVGARERLAALLQMHRALFFTTLGVILLVAIFIFRPMAALIGKRTDELVEARNSMAYNAVHDDLTGLYNRAFLKQRFLRLIEAAVARGEGLAVIQFDLDRFKQINDTLGHAAGDHVLAITAERMRRAGRDHDISVRLGGDEFVLLANRGTGNNSEIAALAQGVLRAINQPIDYEGTTITPGASAGIALSPEDGTRGSELLVHADVALYAAKKAGGGDFSFFTDDLRREIADRQEIERRLVLAIASREFNVCFQPQVSLHDRKIKGMEALVRWKPADGQPMPPSAFIPIAEKTGLMPAVGRVVFRKAIASAAAWHREGLEFGRLALNASGTELAEPDFADFVFQTLQEEGLPAGKLAIEIVESVMLDDEKTGIAPKLRALRSAGIQLELDDFGTGYASLAHVDPREIDRLKIDRRFVHNIDSNARHAHIVRAVTELAEGLGIGIVAEGAETDAELTKLSELGCNEVQGYAISFPMPSENMREWLLQHNRKDHAQEIPEQSAAGRAA